jgi:uncharacterized protein YndB with AHSA1/START domain
MAETAADAATVHELVITRLIPVPRHTLFRCWTEPALITQWFTPPPWKTIHAEVDLRAGGSASSSCRAGRRRCQQGCTSSGAERG